MSGKKKTKRTRKKISKALKGITFEQRFGKQKADELKANLKKKSAERRTEKICITCGKKYMGCFNQKYCHNPCIPETISYYDYTVLKREIGRLRSQFKVLLTLDPEKAQKLLGQMLIEEDTEFIHLALDGLVNNVLKQNKNKEKK